MPTIPTTTITIRAENPQDAAAIEHVVKTAFLHAEHSSHTEHLIVQALRQQQQLTISLLAEDLGEIVGHVAISPVTLSSQTTGWFGLAPVSVLPQMQKQGIGKKLVATALQQLQQLGATGCVVLGAPNYYAQFGFIANTGLTFADVPAEYFQALSFNGDIPLATVEYHAAFFVTD